MKKTITIYFILMLISITSFAQTKSLLMVVPPDLYHDTEFSDPMLALDSAGIKVVIASTKIGKIKGVMGNTIQSEILLKDIKVKDYDGICIMGGKGTGKYLWENEQVQKLLVQFQKKGKLVTGICAGAVSLARAGVLENKTATTYPVKGFIRQLQENGAAYSTDSVYVDGNIITGNGPVGAKAFGEEIAKQLK